MEKSLVVVESPAKAKTISKLLGKEYKVIASVGHIMDLPKNKLGVDIEHDFAPQYQIIKGKAKIIKEIKKASEKVKRIYLAPDPDREGEAISFHISEVINDNNKNKEILRVLINEITKKAVIESINNAGPLNLPRYEAQKARRVLDRLVGYKISPLLWEKVKKGLSAGRVQSVALRLICEREKEIRGFKPEEYWTIEAHFLLDGETKPIVAQLTKYKGKKIKIKTEQEAKRIIEEIKKLSFKVESIEKKERAKNPPPPFITSKLQQEASSRFRFPVKKTMTIAQQLYEGIETGEEGLVGLITYMRTDSTRLSEEAIRNARNFIIDRFGKGFLPAKANRYQNKKGAQDAHEAIRPTSIKYTPEKIKSYLTDDQFKIYEMIWNRFIASQMKPASYHQTTITISAGDYLFSATGSILIFPGFLAIYKMEEEEKELKIPKDLKKGQKLKLEKIVDEQHFTQPPPRFTEGTLVKELEERGIGRPSTYATILSTLKNREYVRMENRRFIPTDLGFIVTNLLVENFPSILDPKFTAKMEDNLDKIEDGKLNFVETVKRFYLPFEQTLKKAKKNMQNIKAMSIPTSIVCDQCGSKMVIRWGKRGKFLSCSRYPECKNTKNFREDEDGTIHIIEDEKTDEICEKCGSPMVVKNGKFGPFLACSNYPACKNSRPLSLGIKCPVKDCPGEIIQKKTKKGKTFYGCSEYPKCSFALWDKPVKKVCPNCGAPFLIEKKSKKGTFLVCINKECGYKEEVV